MALLPFFGFTAKNGNAADATHPASAPIADAGKTAPAPGASAVAVFLDAGRRLLPMPRFGTVSGNGTRHRWKRANPSGREGGRAGGWERAREGGRKRGRESGRKRGREGAREREREGEREREREGEREREREGEREREEGRERGREKEREREGGRKRE